jgi:DNA-binding protein H-NS
MQAMLPAIMASLKGLSVQELEAVIVAAEREKLEKREAARRALLDEVRAKAEALGFSLDSLLQEARPEGPPPGPLRAPVRAKYRHPEPGETWSGRGSVPAWLKRVEAEGRRREEFAVGG